LTGLDGALLTPRSSCASASRSSDAELSQPSLGPELASGSCTSLRARRLRGERSAAAAPPGAALCVRRRRPEGALSLAAATRAAVLPLGLPNSSESRKAAPEETRRRCTAALGPRAPRGSES
jgi:hypothetical protein